MRSAAGFCAPFRISQGTREGCILNPLLFVTILSDVINELQKVHLEAGHMMLGPLLLFVILFADDLVLFAWSVKDLQSLINAFTKYCDMSHEQVAVEKIEAMVFHNDNSSCKNCKLFVRDGILCQRISKHVYDEIDLVYKGQPILWTISFKFWPVLFRVTSCYHFLKIA